MQQGVVHHCHMFRSIYLYSSSAEPPIVDLTGSNNGQPINSGTPVTLRCVPLTGRPNPTLQVRPSVGYNLPSGTRATTNPDGSVTVTVPRLDTDTCFDCIGTNPVGRHTDQECISVLGKTDVNY